MIGLNFADNQEAEAFGKVITDRLEMKQRKREGKNKIHNHIIFFVRCFTVKKLIHCVPRFSF